MSFEDDVVMILSPLPLRPVLCARVVLPELAMLSEKFEISRIPALHRLDYSVVITSREIRRIRRSHKNGEDRCRRARWHGGEFGAGHTMVILGASDKDEPTWHDFANCLGVDPDLFFPERGASTKEAKEVCRGCVVRDDCLEYALQNGEKFGIWGGMSERERRRIRRQRALARAAVAAEATR
jgi:WhiB family redox-sensing transcriptional regulator